jgi:N-acyl-D-aspartate/D-glutamate deacylase
VNRRNSFADDLAISDGKIAAIGEVTGSAARVIDASGMIVAPGFIDCHTHYDDQLFWDPSIDPATWHCGTTAAIGNCGFTIAHSSASVSKVLAEAICSASFTALFSSAGTRPAASSRRTVLRFSRGRHG